MWRVDLEMNPAVQAALQPALADDERVRAARFHFPRDRAHSGAARGALRTVPRRLPQNSGGRDASIIRPANSRFHSRPGRFHDCWLTGQTRWPPRVGHFMNYSAGRALRGALQWTRSDDPVFRLSGESLSPAQSRECLLGARSSKPSNFDPVLLCKGRSECYTPGASGGSSVPLASCLGSPSDS